MIDSHVHISLDSQSILHHKMRISDYLSHIDDSSRNIAFFKNPFDNKFCCPKAFEEKNKLHKSCVVDVNNNYYKIICKRCGSVHYEGEDVFKNDNIELLKLAQNTITMH